MIPSATRAHHLQSHTGAPAAFADTFRWVFGFTALALVPALFLALRPARG